MFAAGTDEPSALFLAGIGIVFGSLIHSVSRNPSLSKQLFGYAILGFALSEAMALFALLVAFLILFGLIGFVGCSAFNAGGLTSNRGFIAVGHRVTFGVDKGAFWLMRG